MKKNLILAITLSIFLMNILSAYSYGYGRLSLGYFFEILGAENIFLIGVLIGSFALLNWVISMSIKDKMTAGIIAFIISLFITSGAYFSNFDAESFFYSIGLSGEVLPLILFLFVLGVLIYLGFRFGFKSVLLFGGGVLIAISLTNLVYEKGTLFILGLVLALIGLWFYNKENKIKNRIRMNRRNLYTDDYDI